MAGSNIVTTKQDSKLESFLRQKLPEDVYDKIRTYEPCFVQLDKVKLAFKYMVLTDERILVTENPPKRIIEEESLHLGEVTSIELVNDLPEFLAPEQRGNSLHIQIKYSRDFEVRVKRKVKRGKPLKEKNGIPDLVITGDDVENGEEESSRRPSLHKHHSLDETDFLLRDLDEDELDENSNSGSDRMASSLPTAELKRLAMSMSDTTTSGESSDSLLDVENGKRRSNSVGAGGGTCRPLPQRPSNNPGARIPLVDEPDTYTAQFATTLVNRRKNSSSSTTSTGNSSPRRSLPSPDVVSDAKLKSQPFQFPTSSDSSPENTYPGASSSQRFSSGGGSKVSRTRSLESPLREEEEEEDDESVEETVIQTENSVMDLYIMSAVSPLLMHLKSTWNNYVIHSTLLLESDYAERKGIAKGTSRSARKPSREQLARLFQQLKDEILTTADSMETLFHLVQELSNAAEKYFFLKKLFWKSDDLFNFILAQLHRYLPKSSVNLNTERGRHHRADELELCTLLIETLGVMFRGTEMIQARLDTLVANNGKPTLDLVVLTTCLPEVPLKWRPPKSKAASLLLETDTENWKTYADAEVAKLVQELCNASTAVMFDLVLIAYQANWGTEEGRFFNICWLMKVLDSLQTTTYRFVERLLAQAMRLLMPSRDATLTPNKAVLLFQQFFLLQTFLQYSTCVPSHIRNNYSEEFRYYVQSPHIVDKLPSKYPITKPTLQLISEVLGTVLQKPTSLQATK